MQDVRVEPIDEVWIRVRCDPDIAHELKDELTFEVPGARFLPKVKMGIWDGKVSLFSPYKPYLYKGLTAYLVEFCDKRGYRIKMERGVVTAMDSTDRRVLIEWAIGVTPPHMEARDYQVEAFADSVAMGRSVTLSSTSSGKTLMLYRLARWYAERTGRPTLVLTTRTNLVAQAVDDFAEYDSSLRTHAVDKGSRDYPSDSQVVVSTWQSAVRSDPEWLDSFGAVLADEVHSWDSASFIRIAEAMKSVRFRHGFTGTLDGSKVNRLTLTGLFGPVRTVSTNAERIAAGDVAAPSITAVRIPWPEADRRAVARGGVTPSGKKKPMDYASEVVKVVSDPRRIRTVVEMVAGMNKNTLVLFNRNEAMGEPLRDAMTERLGADRVRFVNGGVDTAERREAQRDMEARDDVVTVASLGTFSEGMSVKNVHNVVFAYPMKGRVRLLQSIGRGLRKLDGKDVCRFYDVVDDMRVGSRENYLWRHAMDRCEVYAQEGFRVKWADLPLAE